MFKAPAVLGSIACCLVIGVALFLALPHLLWAPTPVTTTMCPGAPTAGDGIPAIPARTTCTPAFTTQDVRAYFAGTYSLGRTDTVGSHLTITRILFTTAHDARRLMGGESVGLPDGAVVCYVELNGEVRPQNMSILQGSATTHPALATVTVRVIFDAHTGNELVFGETG